MESLKDLRKGRGLTQSELAGMVGVSYQQIQKYENGKDRPSLEMRLKLAKALGLFLTDILDRHERKIIQELISRQPPQQFYNTSHENKDSTRNILAPEVTKLIEMLSTLGASDREFVITATKNLIEQLKDR